MALCPSPLPPCCSWPLDAAVLQARNKVNGLAAWAEQQIKDLQDVLNEGLEADERESAEWKHLHRVRASGPALLLGGPGRVLGGCCGSACRCVQQKRGGATEHVRWNELMAQVAAAELRASMHVRLTKQVILAPFPVCRPWTPAGRSYTRLG